MGDSLVEPIIGATAAVIVVFLGYILTKFVRKRQNEADEEARHEREKNDAIDQLKLNIQDFIHTLNRNMSILSITPQDKNDELITSLIFSNMSYIEKMRSSYNKVVRIDHLFAESKLSTVARFTEFGASQSQAVRNDVDSYKEYIAMLEEQLKILGVYPLDVR